MTDKKEIVAVSDPMYIDKDMSPESLKALTALATAKVPKEHIKTHLGRGGKTFSYVPHNLATTTMNNALGMNWDWEILDYQVLSDNTAVARGKMTIHYTKDGEHRTRVITEMGGMEVKGKETPILAFQVLGACSRALLRCMMRAFGYGIEFYKDQETSATFDEAWQSIWRYAQGKKIEKEQLAERIKAIGITRDNLVDRFQDAYDLVNTLVFERENPDTL